MRFKFSFAVTNLPGNNIWILIVPGSVMNQSLKALKAPCVAQKTLPG